MTPFDSLIAQQLGFKGPRSCMFNILLHKHRRLDAAGTFITSTLKKETTRHGTRL